MQTASTPHQSHWLEMGRIYDFQQEVTHTCQNAEEATEINQKKA